MPGAHRTLVLNVDDYGPSRYARTQVLRQAGFDVTEAATGGAALELATSARPDLVMLDVNLPDMSGLEVCRTLKADLRTASVPVLHVSAMFTDTVHQVRGLDSGADAYLVEPVAPPVLLATVNALLRARLAEEALAEALAREHAAREHAEAASRAKDQFLATLSHELRAPLNAILGWTRILGVGAPAPATVARALAVMERSVQQQTRLIEDMLDVSRIITGQLRLDVRLVDLGVIAHGALDAVRLAADAKGVRIGIALDESAPSILGDAGRLQQVAWNLLSNAVKFTPAGGRIDVRLEAARGDVRLVVADTGQGISPEFLPYAFHRFRQAESGPARTHGGLGLGLAIVRHLVELHGGTVSAESAGLGHGATFTVTLPRPGGLGSPTAGAAEGVTPGVLVGGLPSLRGVRVLVVDDDADTREVLGAGLALCGAEVTTCDSTEAALDAVGRERPDVVVSDIGMPGDDGYALIARIRALPETEGARVRAIAVTGYASAGDEAKVLRAGYDLHLSKPVDPDTLAAAVARLVAKRS